MVITTKSAEETIAAGERLAALLHGGDILAYTGGMGAGKTTFTIGLAKGLGLDAWVSSPTFALVHEYEGNTSQGQLSLCHFDMFRISTPDDLYSTGFFDYPGDNRIIAVEWSENIGYALPQPHITVDFAVDGDNTRTITVTGDERF